MPIHVRRLGDTLIPLSVQLLRKVGRQEEVVDLTGLDVQFKMLDEEGAEVVALTDTGVTVVDAVEGKVQYDFDDYDVSTAGDFYAYFVVSDGYETDTFPVTPKNLVVRVTEDVPSEED